MPRWLEHVVNLIGLLYSWVRGRPYVALAQRMGRDAPAAAPDQRRFIIIQIDGLAHDYLQQALALGHAAGVQRLIAQGHRVQRWRCGIPSSTPAVQAGIMYGNNWDIPAFRWYEKDTGLAPQSRSPAHAARIKERVAAGRRGILADGSSYTNMLDGDARLALFTLSAMGRHHFFEHLRGLGWALLFALIPWRIVRIVVATTWELLRNVGRTVWTWAHAARRRRRPLQLSKPVLQALTNVIFGEIQTFGVLLDVYRGTPAIYVNFYGYDEVAHTEGPASPEAWRALRRIDGYIRQIDNLRRTYWPDMDLYICSDHGMTPAVPFDRLDEKKPLGQFVAEHVRASVEWDETRGRAGWGKPDVDATSDAFRWLLDELEGVETHLSRRGQRLAQILRRRLDRHAAPDPDPGYDLARGSDVVVRSSGTLAHLYFNVTPDRMDVSELAILYPDLLDPLARHPGIGLVLGMEASRPVIVTPRGTTALTAAQLPPSLADRAGYAADLARLLSFPHSGDLILLGAWHSQDRIVTFEEQVATHGGVGGLQDYPFFIIPPGVSLDLSQVTNARQLYPFFMRVYHGIEAEADPR